MFRSLSLFLALVPAALAAFSPARAASDYPKQPIQIIVPFTPGGNTDLLGRIMAERLQAAFKETVTVVNRPGAGANIGAAAAASSSPDGYTIFIGPPASFVINQFIYPTLPYDPDTAFSPFSLVARFPNVLVAHPSVGVKSIRELIDKAKANPAKVEYAHAGTGTTSHLAGALFGAMAKINILNVPYKGTSQSLQDLVAGRVAFTIDNLGPILPFIVSGHLVALGVSTKDPASLLPGVPAINTVLEGYELSSWNVMAVPAGTPKDIVEKLSAECRRIVQMPDVIEKMRSFGSEPVGGTPEQVAVFLKEERARWESAVKAANITKDQFK
jgi:tripartite-type tricarboxylate transporter receptor subunit TctC